VRSRRWTVLRVEGLGCLYFNTLFLVSSLVFFLVSVVVLSYCCLDAEQTWLKHGCPGAPSTVDEDDEFEHNIETHVIKQYMRRQEEKNEI